METLNLPTFYTNLPKKQELRRNLKCDFVTILIVVYHMVQWIKVTQTQGQSRQQEDEY